MQWDPNDLTSLLQKSLKPHHHLYLYIYTHERNHLSFIFAPFTLSLSLISLSLQTASVVYLPAFPHFSHREALRLCQSIHKKFAQTWYGFHFPFISYCVFVIVYLLDNFLLLLNWMKSFFLTSHYVFHHLLCPHACCSFFNLRSSSMFSGAKSPATTNTSDIIISIMNDAYAPICLACVLAGLIGGQNLLLYHRLWFSLHLTVTRILFSVCLIYFHMVIFFLLK